MEGGALIFVWVQIHGKMAFKETRKIQRKTPVNLFRDKYCGKINAQTVFTENFPFSIFETHISCTVSLKRFTQLLFLAKEQYEAGVTKQLFCNEEVFAGSFLNVLRWLILKRKNHCCVGA